MANIMHNDSPMAFAGPGALTVADVTARLRDRDDLSERRRRELVSALATFCRWFHLLPQTTPASPDYVRRRLAGETAASLGVSTGRLANVRSLMGAALREAGAAAGPPLCPLTPAWAALDRHLDKYEQTSLRRLFRFCSAQGIAPADVDDDVLVDFRVALETESLVKRPWTNAQSAARIWNRCAGKFSDWPDTKLTVPRREAGYRIPIEAFPASFEADFESYFARLTGARAVFDLDGPARPMKPRTIESKRHRLRQAVSALVHSGREPASIRTLADLVTVSAFRAILQWFLDRNGGESSSMIGSIAGELQAVARYHVKVDAETQAAIDTPARRLRFRHKGLAPRNADRLSALDERALRQYYLLPWTLFDQLRGRRRPTRRDAVNAGLAVALAILQAAPIRITNIAALTLNESLFLPRGERQGRILIAAKDVKNDMAEDRILPAEVVDLIRIYLDRYRPLLVGDVDAGALFPGRGGKPKRSDTLSKQLGRMVKNRLGNDWNAHLTRHIAIKVLLEANPTNYALGQHLLRHRSQETTFRTYAGLECASAGRHLDELLRKIRDGVEGEA